MLFARCGLFKTTKEWEVISAKFESRWEVERELIARTFLAFYILFQFLKKSIHFKPAQVDLFVITAFCLHNLLVKKYTSNIII